MHLPSLSAFFRVIILIFIKRLLSVVVLARLLRLSGINFGFRLLGDGHTWGLSVCAEELAELGRLFVIYARSVAYLHQQGFV